MIRKYTTFKEILFKTALSVVHNKTRDELEQAGNTWDELEQDETSYSGSFEGKGNHMIQDSCFAMSGQDPVFL